MSSLRESFERASLPALTWLSGLPRFVPFLFILGFVIAGVTYNATGDVRSVRVTTSTENANGVSFELHGTTVGSV